VLRSYRSLIACLLGLVIGLLQAAPAFAQEQQRPTDPVAEAPMRFGALGLAPRIAVTNLGLDTNVFNELEDPKQDVTGTLTPALSLWMRTGRGLVSASGNLDFVYFQKYASERSINGGGSVQYEYRFNRLRPFIMYSARETSERPGAEIDVRPRRFESATAVGVDFRLASKTFLELRGRSARTDYDEDASFDGRNLEAALDGTLRAADLTWRQHLTALTTWLVRVSAEAQRFETAKSRENDSVRAVTGFELGRFALIRGSAFVGFRHVVSVDAGTIPEFTGVIADVDVSYTAPTQTRLNAVVKRDLQYSYRIEIPYYVQTGWALTMTQRMVGRWDLRLAGGRERLAYTDAFATGELVERMHRIGGGIGYQLAETTRVGIDIESQQRESPHAARPFKALRTGISASYGF
jgi:hypothetical protein